MCDDDADGGIWAVVYVDAATTIIGEVAKGHVTLPDLLRVQHAVGIKTDLVPINTPQGPAFTLVQQLYPLAGCQNPTHITVRPAGIIWFSDMEENDRRRHKALVDQLMQQLQAARAQRAGITLAGPGEMPLGRRTS